MKGAIIHPSPCKSHVPHESSSIRELGTVEIVQKKKRKEKKTNGKEKEGEREVKSSVLFFLSSKLLKENKGGRQITNEPG